MKTLLFERNIPRFAAARLAATFGSGRGAGIGPLRLVDTDPPPLPAPGWHRVQPRLSGICGSDLATLDGRSSRYFEELVSFPFVPGHEVVGTLESGALSADGRVLEAGARVVIEPVLGCRARAIEPPCPACADDRTGDCELVAFGHLRPGLQTGYCADTGGGWSSAGLVAHHSQLHAVPEGFSDEDAVMVEPVSCAVHAALAAGLGEGDLVAVLGAGTLGLGVTAAVSHLVASGRLPSPGALLVGARYGHQRDLALEVGATAAVSPEQLPREIRRRSGSLAIGTAGARLTGGADVVIDCVGSADSIGQSLAMVRPRGRVALVGMPGHTRVDLAPLWHREITLVGTYAYGTEVVPAPPDAPPPGRRRRERPADLAQPSRVRTFDLALEVVAAVGAGRLVSAAYPLDRFEEAVAHAGAAGRRGAVKVVFDLRPDTHPPRARRTSS